MCGDNTEVAVILTDGFRVSATSLLTVLSNRISFAVSKPAHALESAESAFHVHCFVSFLTPIMYLSLRVLLALGSAVFTSWLATFSFECYYQGPRVGSAVHARDQEPPFPGATADNLFWFLQVRSIIKTVPNPHRLQYAK